MNFDAKLERYMALISHGNSSWALIKRKRYFLRETPICDFFRSNKMLLIDQIKKITQISESELPSNIKTMHTYEERTEII